MNTYQTCEALRNMILARAADVMIQTGADFGIAVRKLREIPAKHKKAVGQLDLTSLTDAELQALGFMRWDDGSPLRLIPAWLHPFLPDELEATTIGGETRVWKRHEIDNDQRFGMLAWGVVPTDKRGGQ